MNPEAIQEMGSPTHPERRTALRLDKVFPVLVESPLLGFLNCIARNISAGGMFLETVEPLPLGSSIRVYFCPPGGQAAITAVGKVRNHYFLNFKAASGPCCVRGMGVRFVSFEDDGHTELDRSLRAASPLH